MKEGSFTSLASIAHADAAAHWITAVYPDVTASIDGDTVDLRAANRSDQELSTIWSCAIVNERLHSTNAAPRAAILTELLL